MISARRDVQGTRDAEMHLLSVFYAELHLLSFLFFRCTEMVQRGLIKLQQN